MKIENNDRRLTLRGAVKDNDLQRLQEALQRATEQDELDLVDLSALRSVDVYLLQLVAVALSEAATRGRAPALALSPSGRDLACRVGLDAHLLPFVESGVRS